MADSKDSTVAFPALFSGVINLASYKKVCRKYYYLCKPGIVYGNIMTGAAGYLFASKWHINWLVFISMIIGMALSIASACVFNNYIDRGIDSKMTRTKKRALVTGTISASNAIIFATILGLLGVLILLQTNLLTVVIGLIAVFSYIVLYGYAKRNSVHGTLVGTIPGSAALVAGYTAYVGKIDIVTWLLLAVMVTWQMAHFYSIAIYRLNDYKEAGIPVWPAVKGVESTKRYILFYITTFMTATVLLSVFGLTGYTFAVIMVAIGLYWLKWAIKGFGAADDNTWARKLFFESLIVLLFMSAMLPLSSLFP